MESGYEPANDGKWFHGEFQWRKIGNSEIDQMVEHMRTIHQKRTDGSLQENTIGIESAQKFTWKKAANTVHDNLIKLSGL